MPRIVSTLVTAVTIFLAIAAAWVPIEVGKAALHERFGAYEPVGWSGTGLHLLYTVVAIGVVLMVIVWPLKRVRARMRCALRRLPLLEQGLPVVLIHGALLLPVFAWMGIGVLNAWWDRTPSQAETYRFIAVVPRHKGPANIEYTRADDPSETLTLHEVHPPHGTPPGAVVTLYRHRGALGMPYLSTRP